MGVGKRGGEGGRGVGGKGESYWAALSVGTKGNCVQEPIHQFLKPLCQCSISFRVEFD